MLGVTLEVKPVASLYDVDGRLRDLLVPEQQGLPSCQLGVDYSRRVPGVALITGWAAFNIISSAIHKQEMSISCICIFIKNQERPGDK